MSKVKCQILGIGSPILCDDSAGLKVVEGLQSRRMPSGVVLTRGGTGGMSLLDLILDCEKLIIVDAVICGTTPGTIHEFDLSELSLAATAHLGSSHGLDLSTALLLMHNVYGRRPAQVKIIGIEAQDISTFSEQCTPAVQQALKLAEELILSKLATILETGSVT